MRVRAEFRKTSQQSLFTKSGEFHRLFFLGIQRVKRATASTRHATVNAVLTVICRVGRCRLRVSTA